MTLLKILPTYGAAIAAVSINVFRYTIKFY